MRDGPIEGVHVIPLRQFPDDRGAVLHMLRADEPHFEQFGEIYFSKVNPGAIKAWHLHRESTINYAVPVGVIRFVLYDDRHASKSRGCIHEIRLGENEYQLVTVPSGIWNGFQGLSDEVSLVANCATLPHDENEIERADPFTRSIPYEWPHDG